MNTYYATKGNRAFEFVFNGNTIESVKEVRPIERLGDLNNYSEWDEVKAMKARRFMDMI